MKAKKYEAPFEEYGDLLDRIKQEMGPDVMVQTRRFQRGGFLGLFGVKDWIEVLAAPQPSQDEYIPDVPAPRGARGEAKGRGESRGGNSAGGNGQVMALRAEIGELKRMVESLALQMSEVEHSNPRGRGATGFDPVSAAAGAGDDLSPAEHEVLSTVIGWDIHPERALRLVKKAVAENPGYASTLSAEMLLKRVKKVIIGEILVADGIRLPQAGSGTVIAFIGATGVGKTTTIAKLAAIYSIQEERKVALVSLDTYRIAAAEQLRKYADIMKLPISVVLTAEEFTEVVEEYRKDKIVLVDTAGRSPFNKEHMAEVREFFRRSPPDSIQLVMDARTKADDIRIMLEKFSGIGFDQLIITKLDETGSLGSIYTINCLTNRPISWFTVGQVVPDDIRIASVEYIQKWVQKGEGGYGDK